MAWETRTGSLSKFYYRSIRQGDRVVKEYVGSSQDMVVRLVVDRETLSRKEREAALKEVEQEQENYRELMPSLRELERRVKQAVQLIRVTGIRENPMHSTGSTQRQPDDDYEEMPTRDTFGHLLRLANRGDQPSADRLRRILRDNPEIWQTLGNLSQHVEQGLLQMIAPHDFALRESLTLQLSAIRESFAEPADGPAEQLLIDHLLATWLELQGTRMAAAQMQERNLDTRFWDRRYEQATKRHLAAIQALREQRGGPAAGVDDPTAGDTADADTDGRVEVLRSPSVAGQQADDSAGRRSPS